MEGLLNRAELVLGQQAMKAIAQCRVLLVGVGGVGSWCAESLVRTGIRHLTIVDADCVCVSNINRQLMATTLTVGRPKVEVLRERLLTIVPDADITALQAVYSPEAAESFHLDTYDYIIDCIDSLRDKIDLLMQATRQPQATVFSSMGAALKLDPTRIQVAEFWQVKGCPLASAMRSRMRHNKWYLRKKVQCVFSEERLENKGITQSPESTPAHKAQVNGSLVHITAIYGFTIAGLVIQHICRHLPVSEA